MDWQRRTYTGWFLVVLQFVIICSSQDPNTSWVCKAGKCVKTDSLSTPHNEILGSTLEICRITCGRYGSLWPRPTGHTAISNQVIAFHPSRVTFDLCEQCQDTVVQDYLQRVVQLFQNKIITKCGENCTVLPNTDVAVHHTVTDFSTDLNWNTDEGYRLEILTRGTKVDVQVQCRTVYGCRHALETLGQLVTSYTTYSTGGPRQVLVIVAAARIIDSPAFKHRGLVLDTARNYLPISAIERTLDGLSMTKMNVLHWHITDTQSFPLNLPRLPQMSRFGAYSPEKVYNVKDIQHIHNYARLRGIRVIMEIDAPAHSGNGWQWGESAGLGKLAVCVNQQPWRKYCIQPPCGQLNPTNPNLYEVLRDVYRDIIEMTPPGEVFHMGGDEVFFPCWNSSSDITSWLEARGRGTSETDFLQLWAEFQATALQIFDEASAVAGTPIMLWSSHLTDPLVIDQFLDKKRYVIETWVESKNNLSDILLSKGYKLVLATKDRWYLDHGFWGSTIYHKWREAYDNKLPTHQNVLGGEAAMWAELVDDASLDMKVWPRTGAVAERLWSNPSTNSAQATSRFYYFRERLVQNGIKADAVAPQWCVQNEDECL